jgi:hypothetical protein
MLLFGEDKEALWAWKAAIVERLAGLRLTIHPAAQPRPAGEGVAFLGFIVFPEERRLKRRKGVYYRRKFQRLLAAYRAGQIPLETVSASVLGWVNHVRYGNTAGLRKAVLQIIYGLNVRKVTESGESKPCGRGEVTRRGFGLLRDHQSE